MLSHQSTVYQWIIENKGILTQGTFHPIPAGCRPFKPQLTVDWLFAHENERQMYTMLRPSAMPEEL